MNAREPAWSMRRGAVGSARSAIPIAPLSLQLSPLAGHAFGARAITISDGVLCTKGVGM